MNELKDYPITEYTIEKENVIKWYLYTLGIDTFEDNKDFYQESLFNIFDAEKNNRITHNSSFAISTIVYKIVRETVWKFFRDYKSRYSFIYIQDKNDFDEDSLWYKIDFKDPYLHEYVSKMLSILTENQKEIMQLHYFEDLSSEQIAKRKNTTKSVIENIIYRSLKKIREVYKIQIQKDINSENKKDKILSVYNSKLSDLCKKYNINRTTVNSRLKKGMSLEEALNVKVSNRTTSFATYRGKTQSIYMWCKELGISQVSTWAKIKNGMSPNDALLDSIQKSRKNKIKI